MVFKGVLVIVSIALVICTVQGFPRDSSVLKTEEITQIQDESTATKDQFVEVSTTTLTTDRNEVKIPEGVPFVDKVHGPVSCQFEEATEDQVCQKHCLPKGYSYGLCVGFKCSCI